MPGSRGNPGAFRLDWVSWQFSCDVGECILNITCGISLVLVPLSNPTKYPFCQFLLPQSFLIGSPQVCSLTFGDAKSARLKPCA